MKTNLFVALVLSLTFAVTFFGCKDSTPSGGGDGTCSSNEACAGGEVCVDSTCMAVCDSDANCSVDGEICENSVCVTGERNTLPIITSVIADGSTYTEEGHFLNHLFNSLTINGTNLAGASVALAIGTDIWDLDICDSSATHLAVAMPADLRQGTYTLSVANQVGSCEQTLPILQGEPGANGVQGAQGDQGAPGVPCVACVDTATIEDAAVTSGKMASDSVDSANIIDGTILGADITDGTILGADINSDTTISAADFVRTAPVTRTLWLGVTSFATNKNDWAAIELYRKITDTGRLIFAQGDADTVLDNNFAAEYAASAHGPMALYSQNAEDITASSEFTLSAGDRITAMDCYFFDLSSDSRVQAWLEKQALLDNGQPNLLGRVLHSGKITANNLWLKHSQTLDDAVAADTLYRVRIELNLQGDGDSENIGFRGCKMTYETFEL